MSTISEKTGPADRAKTKAQLLTELNEVRQHIAQLEAAAEQSKQPEERYRSVVTAMAEGVVMLQRSGEIVACNPAAEQILGLSREQMMGRTAMDPRWRAIHEDGAPFPGETHPVMVTLQTGQPQRNVIMGVHKPDGSLTWILINSEPMFQPGASEPYAVVATFTDITQQRQAEASLRQSERKFRQVVEQSKDAIILTDETGRLIEWNPAAEQISGLKQAEVLGWLLWDNLYRITPPEQQTPERYEQLKAEWLNYFQTGRHPSLNQVIELEMQRSDGTRRMMQTARFSIKTERGYLLSAVIRDVTEHKRLEAALRESKERLDMAVKGAELGTWDWHVPTGRVVFNERWAEMLGYTLAEIEPHVSRWEKLLHPDDASFVMAAVNAHLEGRTLLYQTEHRLGSKSGEWKWILDTGKVVERDAQGQPVRVVGIHQDITARKQAEESLRASEQKLRQIIERSGDGIMLTDETGRIVEWNPAVEQITGLRRAEVMSQPSWEVLFNLLPEERQTPDVYEYIKSVSHAYFQSGQDPWVNEVTEFELQRPDGGYRDIQTVDFSTQTERGFGRGSITRDVTERKQAERAEAAQLAVSQVLAKSPDPAVALRQILAAIAGRLEWQLAELWWFNSDDNRLHWQDGWYPLDQPELAEFEQASRGYTFAPGQGLVGTVWQAGRAIWDQALCLLQPPRAALAAVAGFRSAVGIPLIKDGETVGVMTFFSRSARPLEERLLTTLTDLGRQIGYFLARKEAKAALQESEERLALILEGAELGTWDSHLLSGKAVFNKQWAEMLGYTLAELEPRVSTWENLIHPDDEVKVKEEWQAHLTGQTPHFHFEHRLRTKSGQWKWILDSGKVVEWDERGQPVRAAGVHLDISVRKEAEETLRRYEQMVSTSPDWLSLVDHSYVYRIVNQTYLTLHNKSYDQIVGHAVVELFGEAVFTTVIKPHLDQALAGETVHYQEWFDFPAAGRRFNDITYAPYRNKDGAISGVLVSGRDITEAKLLEEHLQRIEKMETVGQLAAGMAHHYNSMLTGIIGFTSLALRTLPPDNPTAKNLERVLSTAERMAVLVRQLLAFAQKQLLQPQTASLNNLVLRLQSELERLIPAPIELAFHLAPEMSQVKVDPGQFEHLLRALVSNAIDAMPIGGRLTLTTATVSLGAVEAGWYDLPPGDYVLLTVKDTGVGLTEEVKAHLFEPFFTTKEVGQGTGLGLAMALGIAKQHGGHLFAESESGQGATFMLYLPCLVPAPLSPSPVPVGPAQTILLIEAEPMVREFVAEILSDEGYTVLKTATIEVAQERMAGRPGVLLQLLLTPAHSNSLALIEQLKTNSPGLKVIFLIDELEELPPERVDFLLKPFTPSSLMQKIRAALEAVPE